MSTRDLLFIILIYPWNKLFAYANKLQVERAHNRLKKDDKIDNSMLLDKNTYFEHIEFSVLMIICDKKQKKTIIFVARSFDLRLIRSF